MDRDGERDGLPLQPGNLDQESYESLINHRQDDVENEHIISAYEYFYEQIESDLNGLADIRDLHDKVLANSSTCQSPHKTTGTPTSCSKP